MHLGAALRACGWAARSSASHSAERKEHLSQSPCPEGPSLEAARLAPPRIQWGSPPQAIFPAP
eukprot:10103371-Alexandrium_andersonii.AAC.1